MIGIATRLKPYSATLVPEKRKELTTEGGLNVLGQRETLHAAVSRLRDAGILVSLFIDPNLSQLRAARQVGADAVEIHTGTYCEAYHAGKYAEEIDKIRIAAAHGNNIGLKVFAGHGLDVRNLPPILSLPEVEEFNIGHSIIARAIFIGLGAAVREMADLIHGAP
jgi:pyridoxine 5-phosphate synthase